MMRGAVTIEQLLDMPVDDFNTIAGVAVELTKAGGANG